MEAIFNLFKVKFEYLDRLINKHCPDVSAGSEVNVFINLEPVMRKLSSANIEDYLKVKKEEKIIEMISCIFNLAAHYRLFFKKNKIKSYVYIYMSDTSRDINYKNRHFIPDYRESFNHKYKTQPKYMTLNKTLLSSMNLLQIIMEYIDGVYFIKSGSTEASVIPHMINKMYPNNRTNFIISNEKYEYQYTNNNYYIIVPKKEESFIVTKENVIENLKIDLKVKTNLTINSSFITTILSLIGDEHRGIPKLKRVGLSTILKVLNDAIENNIIAYNTNNYNMIIKILHDSQKELFVNNYLCTDVGYQDNNNTIADYDYIKSQIKDKFDNLSLKRINDEHFMFYPLMLLEIEQYRYVRKQNIKF